MELNDEGRKLIGKYKAAKLEDIERILPHMLDRPLFSNQYSALVALAMMDAINIRRSRIIRLINEAVRESEWRAVMEELTLLAEGEPNQLRQRKLRKIKALFCKATLIVDNGKVTRMSFRQ